MTVPPWCGPEDPEPARPYFRELRRLRDQHQPPPPHPHPALHRHVQRLHRRHRRGQHLRPHRHRHLRQTQYPAHEAHAATPRGCTLRPHHPGARNASPASRQRAEDLPNHAPPTAAPTKPSSPSRRAPASRVRTPSPATSRTRPSHHRKKRSRSSGRARSHTLLLNVLLLRRQHSLRPERHRLTPIRAYLRRTHPASHSHTQSEIPSSPGYSRSSTQYPPPATPAIPQSRPPTRLLILFTFSIRMLWKCGVSRRTGSAATGPSGIVFG